MKKGLLLSVIASTMIFAGGDIAPVEPAAVAPASDCSDFSGAIGFYYKTKSTKVGDADANPALFDEHLIGATAMIRVEKEIAYGIGFGAEVAGFTSMTADTISGEWQSIRGGTLEFGELSELYLTYSVGNTAVKAGRFALPKKLSPYVWTDDTQNIKDVTFQGVLVANTDIADTTIYGAHIWSTIDGSTETYLNANSHPHDEWGPGLFVLGFVNSSIANTTISGVGYYTPVAVAVGTNEYVTYAGFLTADTTFMGLKASVRGGYVGGDDQASADGSGDATFGVGAKIGGTVDMFDWDLRGTYISDGQYEIGMMNPFYTSASQIVGTASYAVEANIAAKVGPGTLYAKGKYTDWDFEDIVANTGSKDNSIEGRIGYKMKVFSDVTAKAEYRYKTTSMVRVDDDTVNQEIRLEATYAF
ncbi:MAG: hypothetical protein HF962_04950 [Sulfurovum sp.]|nr:hypothetical protein [Sulfurovum sp.]